MRPPLYVPETTSVIRLIETLRQARGQIALVSDEYGMLKGVVSPIDILEAIAGEFPDEDETPEIQPTGTDRWTVSGSADLHQLEQTLHTAGLVSGDDSYTSLAGFLLHQLGRMPQLGEMLRHGGFVFRVEALEEQRIATVEVVREAATAEVPESAVGR